MAITRFQDLPSTNTPINSTNLNGNFDELGVKVGTSVDNNYRVNVLHSSNLWHYNTTKTTNGVTSTYENSTITLNGTATGSGFNVPTNSAMLHLNAGNYALKLTKISGTKPSGQSLIIRKVTSGTNLVDTDFSTTNTYTFALNSDADIAVMVYFWNNNVFNNYKFGVQLQEGSKTDAYKPYIAPSIVVDNEEIYTKGQNEVYSTGEIRIGTWIDGKPLYRKTIVENFELPIQEANKYYDKKIAHNISNFSKCIKASLTDGILCFPYLTMEGGTTAIIMVDKNNVTIRTYNDYWPQSDWYITLEYTKTTDA